MSYEPFSDGGLLIQSGIPVRIKDTGGQGRWLRVPLPEAGEEGEVLTVQPDLSADWEPPTGGGTGVTYNFTYGLPQPEWHLPFFPPGAVTEWLGIGIPATFGSTSTFGANVGGVTVSTDWVNFATGTGTAVLAALPVFIDYNVDPSTRPGFTYSYFNDNPGMDIRLTLSSATTVSNGRIIRTAGDTSAANAYDTVFGGGSSTVFTDYVLNNVNLTASNNNTPNVTVTLAASRTWTLAYLRYSLV